MPKNTRGMKLTCPNPDDHYTWYYTGDKDVTSCPRCGWRVRVFPAKRVATRGGDSLLPDSKRDRLI